MKLINKDPKTGKIRATFTEDGTVTGDNDDAKAIVESYSDMSWEDMVRALANSTPYEHWWTVEV